MFIIWHKVSDYSDMGLSFIDIFLRGLFFCPFVSLLFIVLLQMQWLRYDYNGTYH